jgi:hypothetical protein
MRFAVRSPSEARGRLGFLLRKTSLTLLLAVALTMTVGVGSASAGWSTSISVPNSGISGYTGPYGTLTIALVDAKNATVTLTGLKNGSNYYMFGDGGTLGLNTTGGAASVSGSISYTQGYADSSATLPTPITSGTQNGFDAPSFQSDPGNEDGFGSFNFGLKSGAGYKDSVTSLSFTLHNDSATDWTFADNTGTDVLTGNNNGTLAAAHVFVSSTINFSSAAATGYAANGGSPPPVPAPSTLALAFAGLGACGFVGLRRRSLRPAAVPV